MNEKIVEIMSLVFECEPQAIVENGSPDNIAGWDSLRHMKLVAALEEEFGIVFNDGEIAELLNIELIAAIVEERLLTKEKSDGEECFDGR